MLWEFQSSQIGFLSGPQELFVPPCCCCCCCLLTNKSQESSFPPKVFWFGHRFCLPIGGLCLWSYQRLCFEPSCLSSFGTQQWKRISERLVEPWKKIPGLARVYNKGLIILVIYGDYEKIGPFGGWNFLPRFFVGITTNHARRIPGTYPIAGS